MTATPAPTPASTPRQRSFGKRLLRVLTWISSVLLVLAASGWIYWRVAGHDKAVAIANGVLGSVLAGKIEVQRFESVSPWGASGIDAVLRDPQGRVVAEVQDVSARIAVLPLVRELLLGKGPLVITISDLHVRHARLHLQEDAQGELTFLSAIEVPEEPAPTETSPPTLVRLEGGRIEHAWVHGAAFGMNSIDLELSRLGFEVRVEEVDVMVRVPGGAWRLRSLPGVPDAAGKLEAGLVYRDTGTTPIEQALAEIDVAVDGQGSGRSIQVRAKKRGEALEARVGVQGVTADDFARLGVPFVSPEPTSLELEAHGTLRALDFQGRGSTGPTRVGARGQLEIQPELALRARVEIEKLELERLANGLSSTPLDAQFDVTLQASDGGVTGTLRGTTQALTLEGQRVPALEIEADLTADQLTAQVNSNSRATHFELSGPHPAKLAPDSRYDFVLHTTVGEVRQVLRGLPVQANGRVQARGSYRPHDGVLRANIRGQLQEIDAGGGNTLEQLNFEVDVDGPTDNPRIDATVWGENANLQGRHFGEIRVTSRGTLRNSRASVVLRSAQGDITVETDWGVGREFASTGLDVAFQKDRTKLRIQAKQLRVRGGGVEFEELRISGAGTLEASGFFSAKRLRLVGSARDLDLQVLADAAQVEGYQNGGQLDFDADFELDINHSKGRVTIRVKDFLVPTPPADDGDPLPPEKLALTLDAIGEGPQVVVHVNAETDANEKVDGTTAQAVAIGAEATLGLGRLRSLLDGPSWADSALAIQTEGDLDLGRLSRALPHDWPATADGTLHLAFQAERVRQAAPPSFDLRVQTHDLAVRFAESQVGNGHVLRAVRDVDLRLRLRHDPSRGLTELKGALLYRKKPLMRVNLDLTASIESLLGPEPAQVLRRAPFDLKVRVPRSPIRALPPVLGLPNMRGDVLLRLNAHGTANEPELELQARTFRLSPDFDYAREIDIQVEAKYAAGRFELEGKADNGGRQLLHATVLADVEPRALTQGRLETRADANIELTEFPLDFFQSVTNEGVVGPVSGQLRAKNLGTLDPEVKAEFDVSQVRNQELKLTHGLVRAQVGRDAATAEVDLAGQGWSLESQGQTNLVFDGPWSPRVGDRQSGSLRADKFRLALLMPLVADSLAELDGSLDVTVNAEQGPDGTVVEASASLRDGKLQMPALGQQLKDIRADLYWDKSGQVRLENASFRGIVGRGEVSASGRMQGLSPRHFEAKLSIARDERLPLSLEGFGLGEIYAQVSTRADFEPAKKRIVVKTRVEQLNLRMPEIPSANVQSLDVDEHVSVGVYLDDSRFVTLPLQPIEEEEPVAEVPWTVELGIALGSDVWVQQGPTRRVQLGGALNIEMRDETRLTGQLTLSRGRIEINGRLFDINEGTITFQPEDPANPIVVAEASWTSPDGTVVYASFVGPVNSGKMRLRSEPSLSQGEILSLVLFGTTDGLNNVGSASNGGGGQTSRSQAVAVGGGVATQGFNQALSRFNAVDVSTRINSDDSGNARPEVVIQITSSLSAQLGYNLEAAAPGKSPDRTLLVLELRLVGGHALATTVGDKGTGLLDYTWRYRY